MIELMRALYRDGYEPWQLLAGKNRNALLAGEAGREWFDSHVISSRAADRRPSVMLAVQNEGRLRRHVGDSLVHRTYHPVIDLLPSKTTVIETLHDLWDFVATEEAGARAAYRRHIKLSALKRADQIICVSRSTRDLLGNLYPELADRSIVIPHGTRRLSNQPSIVDRARPFFLFIGQRGRYKNFAILLTALEQAAGDIDLVCFGGGPFSADEMSHIARSGLSGRVEQAAGDDDALAGYYEAAIALVYPSKHEGFGLPVLEAMSHGCPVIASPLTSLPEVGGDAAVYADANDVAAWACAMNDMLEDQYARTQHIAAGRIHAAKFSWEKSARMHAEIYSQLK